MGGAQGRLCFFVQATRDTLAQLFELQKVDSAIDRLDYRRRNLPEQAELDELSGRLSAVQRALGEQQARADDSASRQRKLDGEIESLSAKIAAEEAKLFAGKVNNPKELAALQSEIEYLKNRRGAVEDEDLEVMEEREEVERRLQVLSGEEKELRSSVAAQTERRDQALAAVVAQAEAEQVRRDELAAKIDADLLSTYDDLRSAKSGVAIAALVDGACQGCHMKLPAQEVAQMRRTEGFPKCIECGRLLIVG